VLQKSKVAGPRFFRENTKREVIADSYNLNRWDGLPASAGITLPANSLLVFACG